MNDKKVLQGQGSPDAMAQTLYDATTAFLRDSGAPQPARLTLDSDLERDLQLDSLARAELLVAVERAFRVQLPEQVLGDADTLGDILDAVNRQLNRQPGRSPRPSAPRDQQLHSSADADAEQRRFELPAFDTFQDVLQWHAREHPQRVFLQWVRDQHDIVPLTYGELHEGALRVARGLLQKGLKQGETVALMLPTGTDYFYAFFGVMYAGGVPVPLYPPARASQLEEHLKRQAAILNNAGVHSMITVSEARRLGWLVKSLAPALNHVLLVDELWETPLEAPVAGIKADDLAFLQYTSGSTGQPKGVMLTHRNLFANISAMNEVLKVDQDDVFVSWLPLYHDMGLIGSCLSSLWYGMRLVLMSPLLFLGRPVYWLWAMDHFRGTLSASPNFGYELCLKRLDDEDVQGLDLSRWRIAFNGAEAVSPDTVQRFIDRFSDQGFRAQTMAPVYGLAENCVGLTFPHAPREPLIDYIDRETLMRRAQARPASPDNPQPMRVVACGRVIPHHRLRVIDGRGKPLADRREGDVQFSGPSATAGYYNNPEATAKLFDGEWLNTGDRGYLVDGELFLSGRSKDMIVRAGRNIYPTEIEDAVGALEQVRSGCVAAFAARAGDDSEQLVVVAEVSDPDAVDGASLKREIADIAMDSLGIAVDQVLLVPPRTIPKTSSGKLRRQECRQRYERDELLQRAAPLWLQIGRLLGQGWRHRMTRAARTGGRWLYGIWAWLMFVPVALLVWLLVNLLPGLRSRWWVNHHGARLLALLTGTRVRVDGLDQLAELPPGCVVVANHASYLDGLLLAAALPVPVNFVAKKELARFAMLRRFMRLMDMEVVDRQDLQQGVADSRRLSENAAHRRLLFFPEGTFDTAPGLKPFRMGAFMTAAAGGLPVLPVALGGTREKLFSGTWLPRPGGLRVSVGEPLRAEGDDWAAAVRLREQVRDVMLSATGEADRAVSRQ